MLQIRFLNVPLTSNAFTWHANYYSIADNKDGVGVLGAILEKFGLKIKKQISHQRVM